MSAVLKPMLRGELTTLRNQIPIKQWLSPAHYELEREKIFRRSWLPVGHTADLPRPGGYVVLDMPVFNTSLLVIRGNDGQVRSFHNICRHRGNKIVREGSGCKPAFMCGFHGWTYTPEGKLDVVTDEHQFRDLDKAKLGLIPITTAVWEGFIFVNFDDRPRQTLAEWLGELHGQYSGYFDTQERITSHRVVLNCNWNLGVNSFTEGYHTLFLHRNTVPDYQGGKTNPLRHRPSIELLERHYRHSAPANPDHKASPAEEIAFRCGHKMLPASVAAGGIPLPEGVNPSKYDKWLFDVVELFPNFVMLLGHYWHIDIWFWPLGHDKTVITQDFYAYKAKTLGERVSQEFFRTRGREVFREDLNTLEAQQEMLSSGAMDEVFLSQQEIGLQHHYRVAANMLAQP
ncbi:MAG TPA: aromatic ring-hydroxylating dioxygenase subunit alpha [Alphaproteobacteria bacterium]